MLTTKMQNLLREGKGKHPVEFLMPQNQFDILMDEFRKQEQVLDTCGPINDPRFSGVPIKIQDNLTEIVLRWAA